MAGGTSAVPARRPLRVAAPLLASRGGQRGRRDRVRRRLAWVVLESSAATILIDPSASSVASFI